jgi:hypothetical protein
MKSKRSWFTSSTFKHVRRFLNEPAHILARSCSDSSLSFVFDFALDFIR